MTNKEAFDIIVKYVPICFKEELEIIEKDLEVLEILKKHMWFSFQPGFQVVCNELIDLGNEEEYLKLKEELENEKRNDTAR